MNGTLFLKMFIFAFMGFPIDQNDHYDILYQLHKGTCIRDVFKEEEFMDTNGTFSALFNSYLCHFSLWLMYRPARVICLCGYMLLVFSLLNVYYIKNTKALA